MKKPNLTPGPFDLGDRVNAAGAHYQIVSLAPPDQLGNRPATSLLASSMDDALRMVRLLNSEMSLEKAHEINAGCCKTVFALMMENKLVPLPKDYSLEEMLIASRLVAEAPGKDEGNGMRSYTTHVDPRALALHYAYDHFGSSPLELLEALGFKVETDSVGFCQGCATFIAQNLLQEYQGANVCRTCFHTLKTMESEQQESSHVNAG